jgi:hypothetical protein
MSSESNPGPDHLIVGQVNFFFEGNEKVTLPNTERMKPVETPPEWRNPTIEQLAGVNILCQDGEVIYLNGEFKTPEQQ